MENFIFCAMFFRIINFEYVIAYSLITSLVINIPTLYLFIKIDQG